MHCGCVFMVFTTLCIQTSVSFATRIEVIEVCENKRNRYFYFYYSLVPRVKNSAVM